jgi:hypothetical protein
MEVDHEEVPTRFFEPRWMIEDVMAHADSELSQLGLGTVGASPLPTRRPFDARQSISHLLHQRSSPPTPRGTAARVEDPEPGLILIDDVVQHLCGASRRR